MKKASSGNRRKRKPPIQETSRYPTGGNVYSLQQERQRRQAQEERKRAQEARQAREWQQMSYMQAPRQAKQKTHKRKRRGSQMWMPLLVFAMIALYLVGQIGSLAAKRSDIDVETVAYGTIDTPEMYTGLILREEYVVESSRDGQPYYQYAQGDYVPKGAVVCLVKDVDSTDALESKLEQIDQDILKSQKARTDLSAFSEDISRLEDNVSRAVDAYAGRSMRTSLAYMYTLKSQVTSFMNQRNEIWLTENVDSLSQLTEEKNVYEKQLAQNQSASSATEAGVLCFSYDGMEKKLTAESAEKITKKQIGDAKTQYISKAKSVAKGDPLFKIITDNKWYVVAYLPNKAVIGWEAGKTSRTLNMLAEEETYQISATVEALTAGEKETKVVFSSYAHMEDFMESRTVSFSLDGTVQEGLKIPKDAIVEKSLLKIPRACLTESMGNTGVLLVKGNSTKFTDITAVTGDADAVYIETKDGSLKMGDVVLQGTGEAAEQVTLSELQPHTGVYVANSSVATFAVVEIIEQNQEYAIVKAGSTTGLQAYDTIVSDAKNIKEGDSVF